MMSSRAGGVAPVSDRQTERLQLLAQVVNGDGAARQSLLAALGQDADPRVRMIAEMLAQQGATEIEARTVDDSSTEGVSIDSAEDEAELLRTRRRHVALRRLKVELEFQRGIGDTLAAALGACYLCWGTDSECDKCGGRGVPGWSMPDRELFRRCVQPAILRLEENSRLREGKLRDLRGQKQSQERSPS